MGEYALDQRMKNALRISEDDLDYDHMTLHVNTDSKKDMFTLRCLDWDRHNNRNDIDTFIVESPQSQSGDETTPAIRYENREVEGLENGEQTIENSIENDVWKRVKPDGLLDNVRSLFQNELERFGESIEKADHNQIVVSFKESDFPEDLDLGSALGAFNDFVTTQGRGMGGFTHVRVELDDVHQVKELNRLYNEVDRLDAPFPDESFPLSSDDPLVDCPEWYNGMKDDQQRLGRKIGKTVEIDHDHKELRSLFTTIDMEMNDQNRSSMAISLTEQLMDVLQDEGWSDERATKLCEEFQEALEDGDTERAREILETASRRLEQSQEDGQDSDVQNQNNGTDSSDSPNRGSQGVTM